MSTPEPVTVSLSASAADFAAGVSTRFGLSVTGMPRRAAHHHGNGTPFGRLAETGVGELRFFEMASAAHYAEREPWRIQQDDSDNFKLLMLFSGTSHLAQDGRETLLRAGDVSIYDTKRPYAIDTSDDFRSLVMLFPKRMLGVPSETVGQLTATTVKHREGAGDIAHSFLQRIGADIGVVAGSGGNHLARVALDLVSMVYSQELQDLEHGPGSHESLYARAVTYIDEHLRDPELSSSGIAIAHFVSPRLLRSVFHERGESVTSHIRRKRLERCREDLANPAFGHLAIRSIASHWTFADPAHFTRVFRSQFGETPSAWRAQVLAS